MRKTDWFCCEIIRKEKREIVLHSFYQNYDHYNKKLYKGCEFKTGTEVKLVESGKKGIAMGYDDIEKKTVKE